MSSERALWNNTLGKLSPFGALHRVENKVNSGTADICYCLKRKPKEKAVSGWIELKEAPWPTKATTRFFIESLTLEQVVFAEEWLKVGGRAWLLLQADNDYLLLNGRHMRHIFKGQMNSQDVMQAASIYWRSPWPMAAILNVLVGA